MLHLEGDKQFSKPRPEVWSKLVDLQFLVKCIPDVAEVKEVTETVATLVLRPGFSFVRGELQLQLEKQDATPDASARFLAKTKGIGTSADVLATLTLTEQGSGTRMHWAADVQQLGGLLKAVPRGLIQAAATRVITDLLAGVERELGA
jgi:carbon monoxide dehydrogenase subunit G